MRSFVILVVATVLASACTTSPSPVEPAVASAPAPAPPAGPVTRPQLTPQEVISIVSARYPERLAAGVTHQQRIANMEFLRDRIIETGICGGLNLAWNRKMNGLRSIDALDWRHGADDVNDVVDLAYDYDNPSRTLELHWHVTHGPATWDPYPAPACGG